MAMDCALPACSSSVRTTSSQPASNTSSNRNWPRNRNRIGRFRRTSRLDPAATAEQATGFRRSISATAFKDYLSDPANFWLKHALGMRETSHDDLELDRAGFGTLLHAALEQFGRDESMREVSDPARIATRLSECLDQHFSQTFSDSPEPGLVFQRETARERLKAFAELQAELVAAGWRTIEVEGRLPKVGIHGVEVVDGSTALDYHAASDTWRVYDYKSFDEIKDPAKIHARPS
jgi:hypothetical protein